MEAGPQAGTDTYAVEVHNLLCRLKPWVRETARQGPLDVAGARLRWLPCRTDVALFVFDGIGVVEGDCWPSQVVVSSA